MLSQECQDFLTSLGYSKMPRPEAPPVVEGRPIYQAGTELWCQKDGLPYWPPLEVPPGYSPDVPVLVKNMMLMTYRQGIKDEADHRGALSERLHSKKPACQPGLFVASGC